MHIDSIGNKKWGAIFFVAIFLGALSASVRTGFKDGSLDLYLINLYTLGWGALAFAVFLAALIRRNGALNNAYMLIHELGGLEKLEAQLSKYGQDALRADSATKEESEKAFENLYNAMEYAEYPMAEKIEDYLPGADLAEGKKRKAAADWEWQSEY